MRARTPIERAADYQDRAAQMRRLADDEENSEIRADLIVIAEPYEALSRGLLQSH
jgi:hypothetical protein